jgi:hypothetical protein
MIKVEVQETETKKELTFPKLMKNQNGDIVEVHIEGLTKRTIGIWRTGAYMGVCVIDINIDDNLTDFNGEITLKNE